jgi:hypothetical protein
MTTQAQKQTVGMGKFVLAGLTGGILAAVVNLILYTLGQVLNGSTSRASGRNAVTLFHGYYLERCTWHHCRSFIWCFGTIYNKTQAHFLCYGSYCVCPFLHSGPNCWTRYNDHHRARGHARRRRWFCHLAHP